MCGCGCYVTLTTAFFFIWLKQNAFISSHNLPRFKGDSKQGSHTGHVDRNGIKIHFELGFFPVDLYSDGAVCEKSMHGGHADYRLLMTDNLLTDDVSASEYGFVVTDGMLT